MDNLENTLLINIIIITLIILCIFIAYNIKNFYTDIYCIDDFTNKILNKYKENDHHDQINQSFCKKNEDLYNLKIYKNNNYNKQNISKSKEELIKIDNQILKSLNLSENKKPKIEYKEKVIFKNKKYIIDKNKENLNINKESILENKKYIIDTNKESICKNKENLNINKESILEDEKSILENKESILEDEKSILEDEKSILENKESILEDEKSLNTKLLILNKHIIKLKDFSNKFENNK